MPVVPNLLERTYMLRLNRGPAPMLDLFGGMSLEAAMLALDLGVFEALADGPATPAAVADRIGADETAVDVLLGFLARSGYVADRDGTYALTAMTETWLLESAKTSYSPYFRFWQEVLYPFWREHAVAAIRDGGPPMSVYEWLDDHPDLWPTAQAAFALTAELIGDDIAARLDVPAGGSILDVGGGHGLYSVAVCDCYLSARATIVDDPAVRSVAEENVAASGLDDRIDFQPGDYETDAFESTYDVALAFNVVHGNDRETNRLLFEKLADAVAPGGQLAVLDQFGDGARTPIVETGTRSLDLTYSSRCTSLQDRPHAVVRSTWSPVTTATVPRLAGRPDVPHRQRLGVARRGGGRADRPP